MQSFWWFIFKMHESPSIMYSMCVPDPKAIYRWKNDLYTHTLANRSVMPFIFNYLFSIVVLLLLLLLSVDSFTIVIQHWNIPSANLESRSSMMWTCKYLDWLVLSRSVFNTLNWKHFLQFFLFSIFVCVFCDGFGHSHTNICILYIYVALTI